MIKPLIELVTPEQDVAIPGIFVTDARYCVVAGAVKLIFLENIVFQLPSSEVTNVMAYRSAVTMGLASVMGLRDMLNRCIEMANAGGASAPVATHEGSGTRN